MEARKGADDVVALLTTAVWESLALLEYDSQQEISMRVCGRKERPTSFDTWHDGAWTVPSGGHTTS